MRKIVPILLLLVASAQADVFHMPAGHTSLEFVTVGDTNNAADPSTGNGAIGYAYQIGKYDVTAAQYTQFLNAVAATDTFGLYTAEMSTGFAACGIQRSGTSGNYTYSVAADHANRPVNYVSFYDAERFANWLNNGQPSGARRDDNGRRGVFVDLRQPLSGHSKPVRKNIHPKRRRMVQSSLL